MANKGNAESKDYYRRQTMTVVKNKYIYRVITLFLLIFIIGSLGGCTSTSGTAPSQNGIISGQVSIFQEGSISLSTSRVPVSSTQPEGSGYNKNSNVIFSSGIEEDMSGEENTYIIKFDKQADQKYIYNNVLTIANGVLKGSVKELSNNTYKIKLKPDKRKLFKNKVRASSSVLYLEPDYKIKIQTIPNDPYYTEQWNLKMLNLPITWEDYKGSDQVKVAVVDTGIVTDHPDLKNNIGPGYDVIDEDQDPTDPSTGFSHGTQVAGIIGAVTDNNTGIAGINWNVEIMPIRVMDESGKGIVSNLATGIRWAVDNGANIINLSLASSGPSTTLKEAVQYAVNNGVTVVAASGNNGQGQVSYPARYSRVISVGALGPTKEKAYYSNYGEKLDLVAPGGDSTVNEKNYNTILTTSGNGYPYHPAQGTSMAAPHVSGLAALLFSSGTRLPEDIQQQLINTATPLDKTGMENNYYGAGLVNINNALGLKTPDDNNNPDNDGNNQLNLTEIKLFTVKVDKNSEYTNPTLKTNPDQKGNFALSSPTGERKLIAWLDVNQDNQINSNDYYAEQRVNIIKGEKIEGLSLELKKVEN